MKNVRLLLVVVWILLLCVSLIQSAPLRTTFEGCTDGTYEGKIYSCCPPHPKRPIVDFELKYNSSKPVRIRKALQCLDEDELSDYLPKLQKAYKLMRALPADDPRSFFQQDKLHCAYCTGSFSTIGEGLDIHFGWLFHPWHRWFVYFHERILQSLLEDPTFTLHFWNWDHGGKPIPGGKGCSKAGNKFPAIYADPASPLYHSNRSTRAQTPSLIADLGITPPEANRPPTLPEEVVLARNSEVMHQTMVTNSTTSRVFFGREFRAGDKRLENVDVDEGIGELERTGHASVHWWVGEDSNLSPTAAKDPVFYAHHGNVERLWKMWLRSGPNRAEPTDPDFLDAEFLLYDENADLMRVKVRDSLDTRALGYDYEEVNDASWYYGTSWNDLLMQKIGEYSTTERADSTVSASQAKPIEDPW